MNLMGNFRTKPGKTVIENLIENADGTNFLSDHVYSSVLIEMNITEDEESNIMEQMINCPTHEFKRSGDGWYVEPHENEESE